MAIGNNAISTRKGDYWDDEVPNRQVNVSFRMDHLRQVLQH